MRNFELPGRSPAHGIDGMVATSHTLATATAVNVLRSGGNAMDAAIAACAVQCVVEPESTGVGGDCFCLYAPEGSADLVAFNASGRSPMAATLEWYQEHSITEIERQSPHAVTVPAAVDAWEQLSRDYGTMSLGEILQVAIGYAQNGYPISSRVAFDFANASDILEKNDNTKRVFMPGGRTPRVGERHSQPELAVTLQKIAEGGRDAFFTGEVAEDMVEYLQRLGGLHTLDDFANSQGQYVEPISTEYRGYRVHELPPNVQGVTALQLLNIMAGFKVDGVDPLSVERLHQEIEAGRLAYQDRNALITDPVLAKVPVEWMLSQAHADELRAAIDPTRALDPLPAVTAPKFDSTVYITVVDKDRNTCSFINTLYSNFGAALMAPRFGVTFTNRGEDFVIDADHVNCIAPGMQPRHTLIPGMVTEGDRAVMSFGLMGGNYQAFGHMQFLTKLFDFGMDIQEAMDAPRVFPIPGTLDVEVEGAFPEAIVAGLKALGHNPIKPPKPIGGAQAIWIDWDRGLLTGGSEPRKDGCAMGF